MKRFNLVMTGLAIALIAAQGCSQATSIYPSYREQALTIYKQMSLDERIGQLLLPSYVILANAVSPNGTLCQQAVNNPATPKEQIIHDCGLDQIKQFHLGSVLTGGGPYYNAPTLENWAQLNSLAAEQNKLGSPSDPILLTGNDAIHGNMHVQGAVIFPHDIGLGVMHDPALLEQIGHLVGQDSLASGFNWVYMPTVAPAQDLRWGRAYESFALDPGVIKTLANVYTKGFQDIQGNKIVGALATAKHFIGDGATQYGLDEGDDAYPGNQADFWKVNGPGYEGALQADVGSIMVSYSAISGDNTRMHFGGSWDIINQFIHQGITGTDGQLYRFDGLMVSDWNAPTRAAYFYDQANKTTLTLPQIMAKSINAGIDIIMFAQGDNTNPFDPNSPPYFTNVEQVFNAVKSAYEQGLISEERLQEAVTRILAVKLAMQPQVPKDYAALQAQERTLALKAAEESIVLLKNENNTLPLDPKKIKNVVFIGSTNDLGLQNGGWTVNWQGQKGDQYFTGKDKVSSGAITLEEGIKAALKDNKVNFFYINDKQNTLPDTLNKKDTMAIAVVAEVPYAEYMGDIGNPYKPDDWYNLGAANGHNLYQTLPQSQFLGLMFSDAEAAAISKLKNQGVKVITVVYSGRPIILTEGKAKAPLINSNAVIAAFLPGTLGGTALSNAIFGDYHFRSGSSGQSNTLTFPWPRDMNDVDDHFANGSLFPVGYGLSY